MPPMRRSGSGFERIAAIGIMRTERTSSNFSESGTSPTKNFALRRLSEEIEGEPKKKIDKESTMMAAQETQEPNMEKALTQVEMIRDYLKRKDRIENEMQTLKDDLKELKEEYKGQIDLKTLAKVERIHKIRNSVEHLDTFEMMLDVVLDKAMARVLTAVG